MTNRPRQIQIALLLFAFVLIIYLITAKGFSDVNDAEAYYLLTKAMVERGAVDVIPELTEPSKMLYFEGIDGKLYTHFGLGFSIFSAPLYIVGKGLAGLSQQISPRLAVAGSFFPRMMVTMGCALVAAGSVALLYVLLVWLGLSRRWAVITALLCAFATYMWPYSKIGFYDIHLTFFQMAAIVSAVNYRRNRKLLWCIVAGLALGWGIATRPTLILALLPLAVYMGWAGWQRKIGSSTGAVIKPLVAFAAGLLPWLFVVIWYNLQRTDVPLNFGYLAGSYMPTRSLLRFLTAIYGNTLSIGRGFFLYSPIAILMFWGLIPLWRRARAESLLLGAIILISGIYFSARLHWYDQWPWGPRLLLVLTPLLMVPVGFALPHLWNRRWARRAVIALMVISIVVQLLAIAVPYGTFLHHVVDVAGTWRVAIFNPRYFPIWGQMHTLLRVRFTNVSPETLQDSFISEAVKSALRHSLDFWFIYAYRLGLPARIWIPLLAVLLAGAVWTGQRVVQIIQQSAMDQQQ